LEKYKFSEVTSINQKQKLLQNQRIKSIKSTERVVGFGDSLREKEEG
jgi:hypothetical protein